MRQLTLWLDRFLQWVDIGSLWLARAGGALILLTVGMVVVEVLSRQFTGRSVVPATELTGYIMAISASWAFAYALVQKAHIRIDVLYAQCSVPVRSVLDLVALLSLASFSILAVTSVFDVAWSAWEKGARANTPLNTPLWIPKFLWLVGLCWFSVAVSALTVRVIIALLTRDFESVQRLAGSTSVTEELASDANRGSQI